MQFESKQTLIFKRNLYRLALTGFVVVVIWIGFEIYFSYNRKIEDEITEVNLNQLKPELFIDLAQELNSKEHLTDQEISFFKDNLSQQPAVTPPPPPLNIEFDTTGSGLLVN